jgi:hypothetical protein
MVTLREIFSNVVENPLSFLAVMVGVPVLLALLVGSQHLTEILLLLIAVLLGFVIRQISQFHKAMAEVWNTRDSQFPVFPRSEIVAVQKKHAHWSNLESEIFLSGIVGELTEEERKVLQSLTPELLKDFEIMNDYSLKGKIEMSARVRSFLTGLRAGYWKEDNVSNIYPDAGGEYRCCQRRKVERLGGRPRPTIRTVEKSTSGSEERRL